MTHADIINLWPSLTLFADDLGVPYVTAKAMRRRASIPAPYWIRAVEAASVRGLVGVSLRRLALSVAVDVPASNVPQFSEGAVS
ncbi:hypothetical protein GA0004734_00031600 [Rhizobium sp. 9140]|nr:hypothetical protein GA0004734_00031600 [Rhizobium sp. 9140]